MRGWDDNPLAKAIGGWAAREAGKPMGYARAAGNLVRDAAFLGRLTNPLDVGAKQQFVRGVAGAAKDAARTVARAAQHPDQAVRAVGRKAQQMNRDLDPNATPMAKTFVGEIRRNLPIGAKRGELQAEIASNVLGGPGVRMAAGAFARLGRVAPTAATYRARGYSPELADYFAEPYVRGMGHHFIPRQFTFPERVRGVPLPKQVAGQPLPRWYSESEFNVLKPRGLTKGEMAELHYRVDPDYRGGGRGDHKWSGRELGWTRYGRAGRLWHGSPRPLKDAAWMTGAAPTSFGYQFVQEDDEE
jgi:hypothetical protein